MNSKRSYWALVLGLGLTLALLWLLGDVSPGVTRADPGTRYVAPGGNCGGATPCYGTIQAAVDAATDGDEIRVAAGTYTGVQTRAAPAGYAGPAAITQTVYISKTVTVRGGFTTANWVTPNPHTNHATLDAQRQGRVIFVSGDISPTIEGLRITGGDASGLGGDHWGFDAGGGLFLWYSKATAMFSGNWVFNNTAGNGGGLYLYKGAATVNASTITSNTATSGYGGGLFLYDSDATLNANTVISNTASSGGGGLFLYYSDAPLNANTVVFNTTSSNGGGLFLQGGAATLTNNAVSDNRANSTGSGLFIWDSSPRLLHTTIARNHGGDGSGLYVAGLSNQSNTTLSNTIIVSQTVGIMVTAGNTATLNATLWHANGTNTGGAGSMSTLINHTGDPTFAADGYHLIAGSAAIDKGVNAGVITDMDGDGRPWGGGYDIGADEYRTYNVILPLVMRN